MIFFARQLILHIMLALKCPIPMTMSGLSDCIHFVSDLRSVLFVCFFIQIRLGYLYRYCKYNGIHKNVCLIVLDKPKAFGWSGC